MMGAPPPMWGNAVGRNITEGPMGRLAHTGHSGGAGEMLFKGKLDFFFIMLC